MGILKRKVTDPTPVEPTKLKNMATDDVYLIIESNLMEAQYALSEYRKSEPAVKGAILQWIRVSLESSSLGCQELISRNT